MKTCQLERCKNTIPDDMTYCSPECYQKSCIGRPSKRAIPKERIICGTCSKVFYGVKYDKRKYCSPKCSWNRKRMVMDVDDFEELKFQLKLDARVECFKEFDKVYSELKKKMLGEKK